MLIPAFRLGNQKSVQPQQKGNICFSAAYKKLDPPPPKPEEEKGEYLDTTDRGHHRYKQADGSIITRDRITGKIVSISRPRQDGAYGR